MFDIGQGNFLAFPMVLAILKPGSSPGRQLRAQARKDSRLVDATGGLAMRSMVLTASNHIILTSQDPEELTRRLDAFLEDS
ncbi:MAG: DUF370 domain-containing protein [Deltaproteobacteria bacterium]|jgi:regulator of extracellular matrix RemA (YlzA/DUF370 family)|nr:DUF370 domain-containing protein [Deltaproteobacteria bacterium]